VAQHNPSFSLGFLFSPIVDGFPVAAANLFGRGNRLDLTTVYGVQKVLSRNPF